MMPIPPGNPFAGKSIPCLQDMRAQLERKRLANAIQELELRRSAP